MGLSIWAWKNWPSPPPLWQWLWASGAPYWALQTSKERDCWPTGYQQQLPTHRRRRVLLALGLFCQLGYLRSALGNSGGVNPSISGARKEVCQRSWGTIGSYSNCIDLDGPVVWFGFILSLYLMLLHLMWLFHVISAYVCSCIWQLLSLLLGSKKPFVVKWAEVFVG